DVFLACPPDNDNVARLEAAQHRSDSAAGVTVDRHRSGAGLNRSERRAEEDSGYSNGAPHGLDVPQMTVALGSSADDNAHNNDNQYQYGGAPHSVLLASGTQRAPILP